jgi:predicted RNA-binding Zn-ribbon protein involved in translation (DUF1610 family)
MIITVSRSLISPKISGSACFLDICFSLRRTSFNCPQRTGMSVTHCQSCRVTSQWTLISDKKTVTSATYRNSSFLSPVTNHYHYQKAYHEQFLSIYILTYMFLIAVLISHHSYNRFIIFTNRILYPFLLKQIHATCAVHYIHLTLLFLTIRDKQFKQRSPSLRNLSAFLKYTSLQVSIN